MNRFISTMILLAPLAACVSTGVQNPEYAAAKVIERVGGASDTPDWSAGRQSFYEEQGRIVYINTVTMSGDARPEACNRAATDLGRVQILREIKDNITASGQIAELSATSDPALETFVAFLSQGQLSGVKAIDHYWEKREESDVSGARLLRLHCASKIAIGKDNLAKQLRAALGNEGNAEIRAKLIDAQKQFIDGVAKETKDAAQAN